MFVSPLAGTDEEGEERRDVVVPPALRAREVSSIAKDDPCHLETRWQSELM